MGNHHGHPSSSDEKSQAGSGTTTPRGGSRKGLSNSSSGVDIQEKPVTQLMPLDKLAKVRFLPSVTMSNVFFLHCSR